MTYIDFFCIQTSIWCEYSTQWCTACTFMTSLNMVILERNAGELMFWMSLYYSFEFFFVLQNAIWRLTPNQPKIWFPVAGYLTNSTIWFHFATFSLVSFPYFAPYAKSLLNIIGAYIRLIAETLGFPSSEQWTLQFAHLASTVGFTILNWGFPEWKGPEFKMMKYTPRI